MIFAVSSCIPNVLQLRVLQVQLHWSSSRVTSKDDSNQSTQKFYADGHSGGPIEVIDCNCRL